MPWDRASGMVRAEFPNVNGAGSANAAVLNHWFRRDCAEPSTPMLVPVLFGLCPLPNALAVLTATLIGSGLPDWNVVAPFTPHPEITLSITPVTPFPIGCPLPNGKSTI